MKNTMQRRSAVSAGAIGIGVVGMMLLSAIPTFAQDPADGGQGDPPPGAGYGGGPGGSRQWGGFGGQRPGGPGGPREVSVSRIPFDLLVSTLKLSSDQQGKIAVMLIEARDADQQMNPGQPGQQGVPNPVSRRKRQEADAAVRQQLESVLNGDQKGRLTNTISAMRTLQAAGLPPFVVTKINLTDKQVDDLAATAPTEPTGNSGRDIDRPMAMQSSRKAVRSVLTADQLTMVTTYLNRAMTAQRPRPENGGPDGQGGPGGPPPFGGGNGPGGDNAGGGPPPPPDGGPNTPPAP